MKKEKAEKAEKDVGNTEHKDEAVIQKNEEKKDQNPTSTAEVQSDAKEEQEAVVSDEVLSLKKLLDQKAKEAQENYDRFVRLKAEFENFKRRTLKEQDDFFKYSNEKIVGDLVEVADNLARAVLASKEETGNFEALKEGVEITNKQFHNILENAGLSPVESLHKPFDPVLHEALTQIETDEHPDNTVVQEYQKGYMFKDKVLKHAKVVVSKKKDVKIDKPSKNTEAEDVNQIHEKEEIQ